VSCRRIIFSVFVILFLTNAWAQEEARDKKLKSIQAVRVDTPPIIDGRLDDEVWKQAAIIEDLHQVLPHEYEAPTQRTVFYIMYDKDALYIGARAWDTEPEKMVARILKQGGELFKEDRIGVILDPFNDKRSGYMFELNPNGVRLEGLFNSPTEFRPWWEGIWHGDAEITEDGYTTEMVIPFKTLSFDVEDETWGLNVWREVMRNEERMGWVSYNRGYNPSASGEIHGLKDLDSGMGLDIVPSMSMRQERNIITSDTDYKLEPSLDLFYKITPSMNGSLTINTDFSATEVDDRQVDLTRFSLFFPEKRDFFLKDSDIFEFGNIGQGMSFGSLSGTSTPFVELESGRPFFSRKIGLSATGAPVDLDYGAKISGRIGQWNLGTLAIRQAEFGRVDATDIFVGRLSRNILTESSAGVIMTYGDPVSNLDNYMVGVDFRYLNTRLPGGNTLVAEAWYQQSDTDNLSGDDAAWALGIHMPNRNKFRGTLSVKEVERNFNPAMGFINRRGVRDYAAEIGYTHRPDSGFLREIYGGIDSRYVQRLSDDGMQTQVILFRLLEMANFQGDNMKFRYAIRKEGLDIPFRIYEDIIVPAGFYTYNRHVIRFETSQARKLSVSGSYSGGGYFNGDRTSLRGTVNWLPNKHFSLGGSYDFNDIELTQGDFITRLMTLNSDIVFSNELAWTNLVQYDNVSDNLGFNSRLHWSPQAGRDVYLVFNYNMIDTEDGFKSTRSDITLKANYTFRF